MAKQTSTMIFILCGLAAFCLGPLANPLWLMAYGLWVYTYWAIFGAGIGLLIIASMLDIMHRAPAVKIFCALLGFTFLVISLPYILPIFAIPLA